VTLIITCCRQRQIVSVKTSNLTIRLENCRNKIGRTGINECQRAQVLVAGTKSERTGKTFGRWLCPLALLILLAGCGVRVPDVERRLQALHFESNLYVAQAGDTVASVAHRYQMSPEQLLALNSQLAGSQVFPGDRLVVRQFLNDERDYSDERLDAPVATSHPLREEEVIYEVQQVPDDAVLAEIQANYRDETRPREEIIPDDYVDELYAKESAPLLEERIEVPRRITGDSNKSWLWPSPGEIARDYAPNEINGQGIDIAGFPGQDVVAAADGTVIYTGRDLSNSGNLVIIRHADELLSTYSHTKDLYVTEKDFVRAGDPIASLGWNSNRESVLHFEEGSGRFCWIN